MTHLIFGDGRIYTNHGHMDGERCLMLRDTLMERPVGAYLEGEDPPQPRECFDVIISFKNLAGARLLQDQLNSMICAWAVEEAPKVSQ